MEISDEQIIDFQKAISDHSDYDFTGYSVNSLKRRILKITEEYGSDVCRLIKTISNDVIALEEVVKKITVNTTELYRDPKIWQSILYKILPRFKAYSSINIWHPGCSTGQEVYSMMIMLHQLGLFDRSNIYASDINTDVLDVSRQGSYRLRFNREYIENFNSVYTEEGNDDVNNTFAPSDNYFSVDEARDRIVMHEFLKNKPIYNKIDLVKYDNVFAASFDLIICRNVIIYFNNDLQNRVLHQFHRNMRDSACLVLGMHESIIGPCMSLFIKEEPYYIKRNLQTTD